jgi:hypothetical protein
VFGFVDVVTLLIQILVQIDALIAAQRAIGLVLLFRLPNLPTPVAQLGGFVVCQLTRLHAVDDATGLIRLPLIHARIARCRRRRYGTILRIVLLVVDVTAGLVLFLVQIDTLGTSQLAIGFVGTLELPNITLLASERSGLTARQLAGSDALLNPLPLILLAGIDAGIPNTSLGVTQAGDTHDARDHQHPSEATVRNVRDLHGRLLV